VSDETTPSSPQVHWTRHPGAFISLLSVASVTASSFWQGIRENFEIVDGLATNPMYRIYRAARPGQ